MFPCGCLELASQIGKVREHLCDTEYFAAFLLFTDSDILHKNVQGVHNLNMDRHE